MSYRSRLYNHRNAQTPDVQEKPFFSRQQATEEKGKAAFFQASLTIGAVNDPYEQEADRAAGRVANHAGMLPAVQKQDISTIQRLAVPKEEDEPATNDQRIRQDREVQRKPDIQRLCPECEKEKEKGGATSPAVQKKEETGAVSTASPQVTAAINDTKGKGQTLPPETLAYMNHSFGADFSGVHIHNDDKAAAMNQELQAQAFTHGGDIYFNKGKYNPASADGKFLLAHELTHTIQQGAVTQTGVNGKTKAAQATHTSVQKQAVTGAAPVAGAGTTTCGKPAGCPASFCTPFPNVLMAHAARTASSAGLLAGIAAAVSPRVVPLWSQYLFGGAAPQNISATFGGDFTSSATTAATTTFLMNALRAQLTASPPVFPSGVNIITLPLASLIPAEIAELGDPSSAHTMDFNVIGEIPGNIAGGVGKTQLSCPVGARPSPFDDDRTASGVVTIIRNSSGTLTVIPVITYSVNDTIDLCPGNCGAPKEQLATVPMSMMEASGISGDVPFTVDFPAPAALVLPFDITPPAPVPPTPAVTARAKVRAQPHLNIRLGPSTATPAVGHYLDGEEITAVCKTTGENIHGNNRWMKTDKGFVADFYLIHLDTNIVPDC
jgi:hypothetical protein